MVHNYDWSSSYATALLELDQRELSKRILDASLRFYGVLASRDCHGVSGRQWKLQWMFCMTCGSGAMGRCTNIGSP
jgi:hypothetical protein